MLFYLFLFVSFYFLIKEVKNTAHKKKIIFLYGSVLMIGFIYNAGEILGEFLYLLGVSI